MYSWWDVTQQSYGRPVYSWWDVTQQSYGRPVYSWILWDCRAASRCVRTCYSMHKQTTLITLKPIYLTTDSHLISEYGRRPLRSSTDWTLTVPRTHNRFGDRSFAVAGPRLWNSLPMSLQQISSYGQFRQYLKNHLFGIWEITAQCDAWFSALYKYSYLLTYLLTYLRSTSLQQISS